MRTHASPTPGPTADATASAGSKAGSGSAVDLPDSLPFEDVAATRASLPTAIRRLAMTLMRADLKHWRPLIALAFALTLIAKLFSVAFPILMGEAINALSTSAAVATGPEADLSGAGEAARTFALATLAFVGARFLAAGLPYVRDAFFAAVTQDANRAVAVEAFQHAQNLSLQFHVTRRSGALNRIIERGASAMEYLLRFLAFNIGPTLIELVIAAVALTALYGWEFAAIAVVTVLGYGVFTGVVTEWRTAQRRVANEADTELRARAMDSLTNFETVKAVAAEAREARRYNAAHQAYNVLYVRLMRSLAVLNGGQELIMNLGLLAMVILAGVRAAHGEMGIGDVTAVTLVLFNLYRPLNILGWAWREIKQGAVDMEKLFGLLDVASDVPDQPNARPYAPSGGAVRFDNVSFAHEARAQGLRNVSIDIPAGAFVGVVGPSGAGKSTLLKLLFRFYDPAEGRVLVDGTDARDLAQTSLREALGLVPQEVVLFNDTLRYNIAYARPEASEADILQAAKRAQLLDFIERLPQGLETRVGERGLKLSGGEKQRVGVARAILRDPAILVLDEATSSLDSETEAEVQVALAEAARGRTTIAVAHRLSTIAGADLIVVLEDGEVVAQGTHRELIRAGGLYAAMWARQVRAADTASGDDAATEPGGPPANQVSSAG